MPWTSLKKALDLDTNSPRSLTLTWKRRTDNALGEVYANTNKIP